MSCHRTSIWHWVFLHPTSPSRQFSVAASLTSRRDEISWYHWRCISSIWPKWSVQQLNRHPRGVVKLESTRGTSDPCGRVWRMLGAGNWPDSMCPKGGRHGNALLWQNTDPRWAARWNMNLLIVTFGKLEGKKEERMKTQEERWSLGSFSSQFSVSTAPLISYSLHFIYPKPSSQKQRQILKNEHVRW